MGGASSSRKQTVTILVDGHQMYHHSFSKGKSFFI